MSEFLQRLQERLRSQNLRLSMPAQLKQFANLSPRQSLKPAAIANSLTYLLMIATAGCVTFWILRIIQTPGVPGMPASGISKGMTLYSNQDAASAYGLFGSKPLITDNIFLRGVAISSVNKNGALDGYAIFEIDGKPTNAISVGETLGKGLTLQSIGEESATLLYEGQKLDFKLSKAGKEKSASPNKK